jgi:hypothetical protein
MSSPAGARPPIWMAARWLSGAERGELQSEWSGAERRDGGAEAGDGVGVLSGSVRTEEDGEVDGEQRRPCLWWWMGVGGCGRQEQELGFWLVRGSLMIIYHQHAI